MNPDLEELIDFCSRARYSELYEVKFFEKKREISDKLDNYDKVFSDWQSCLIQLTLKTDELSSLKSGLGEKKELTSN